MIKFSFFENDFDNLGLPFLNIGLKALKDLPLLEDNINWPDIIGSSPTLDTNNIYPKPHIKQSPLLEENIIWI